jgi:hypothetical protein
MRRISFILVFLIVFGTASASAEHVRSLEPADRTFMGRFIRVVRSIFRPQTNGDVLTPPTPAPAPRP